MDFYADTPKHTWRVFGSYADATNDHTSDYDVVLCGVKPEQLDHPYFEETLSQLRHFSVESGNHLDLFIDRPEDYTLVAAFSPERTISKGKEIYDLALFDSKETSVTGVMLKCTRLSAGGRGTITSGQEFADRAAATLRRFEMKRQRMAAGDFALSEKHFPQFGRNSHEAAIAR